MHRNPSVARASLNAYYHDALGIAAKVGCLRAGRRQLGVHDLELYICALSKLKAESGAWHVQTECPGALAVAMP
jgi:hypothetical protein